MAQTRKTDPGALRTLVIGTAVVASLFFVNVHYPSLLALAELKTFDLRMYTRGTRKPQGEVAIVAIDDKSIVDLGRWPWPRTVFAQLTQALKDYHVAVVGFDLVFSERDDGDNGREKIEGNLKQPGLPADKLRRDGGISNDQIFANAIKEQGTTFVGYPFQIALPERTSPSRIRNQDRDSRPDNLQPGANSRRRTTTARTGGDCLSAKSAGDQRRGARRRIYRHAYRSRRGISFRDDGSTVP